MKIPRLATPILALGLAASACAGPASSLTTGPPGATTSPPESRFAQVGSFSAVKAMEHLEELAGRIGPRAAVSDGYLRGTRYVEGVLHELGYKTRRDPFEIPGVGESWNTVARAPGARGGRLLIGAHLDTVEGAPGGNDNASGVATVLELARIFADTRFVGRITFVAFGAEERQPTGEHHYGSDSYSAEMSEREAAGFRAMVSVDMIGKNVPLLVAWMSVGSRATVDGILAAADARSVAAEELVTPKWSDNGAFELIGVPSALMWTGFEPNHHEVTDTADNVDLIALRNAGRVLKTFVLTLLR
ncbi:MAG: M28 family peptidase [Actinomycetota bacterium]